MPTSNPTPNCTEFVARDFFPQSPDLSPEPTNGELQLQINESNSEVAGLNHKLSLLTAQMHVSVEEAVMVSEAHLEHRMEQRMQDIVEEMKMKLENDVDVRVKMEFAVVSAFLMVICLCAAIIARVFVR